MLRNALSQSCGQQIMVTFVPLENHGPRMAGLSILISDGKNQKKVNKRKIGVAVFNAGNCFVLKIQNMKLNEQMYNCSFVQNVQSVHLSRMNKLTSVHLNNVIFLVEFASKYFKFWQIDLRLFC